MKLELQSLLSNPNEEKDQKKPQESSTNPDHNTNDHNNNNHNTNNNNRTYSDINRITANSHISKQPKPPNNSFAATMASEFIFTDHSHRRFNPLLESWILCSPHRSKRPWQGAREDAKKPNLPSYDEKCYLCPGNIRATGDSNPHYEATYVFPNDYPAVKLDQPDYVESNKEENIKSKLMKTEGVRGKCFVLCFDPNHSLSIPLMKVPNIVNVVNMWTKLYKDLQEEQRQGAPYKYLQIFENKGQAVGCSNPHPHGQAWCVDTIPTDIDKEITSMNKYVKANHSHLLGDYVELELQEKERLVVVNDSFIAVVPYWALWPFETLVIARTHLRSVLDFNDKHREDLASLLKELTTKYDNLFVTSFPYSMGLHQAPLDGSEEDINNSWFHMHFFPPLVRSATVKKFIAGFEMLCEPQRDLTSEQAASRLQELDGGKHFMEMGN